MDTASVSTPKRTRSFTLQLLLVTLAALVGRVAYVWFVKRDHTNTFKEGDAFFYSNVAVALGRGDFFHNVFSNTPASDHPPLTVLVLGPTAVLFDDSILAQRMTMAVIGAAAVFVIGLVGRQIAGNRAGLLAAAAAALYPNLWVNDGLIMSESISALTTAALVLAGFRLAESPTLRRALEAGVLCGLTVLARAEVGLLLPFMIWPILAFARSVPWKARLARMAAAAVATAIVVAPWTIYNLTQYPEPVLISLNDGTVLRGAYCDETFPGGDKVAGWSLGCVLDSSDDDADPSVNAAKQRGEGLQYARDHLRDLPEVVFLRIGRSFGYYRPDQAVFINTAEGRTTAISWWCWWTFWLAIPIAVYGLVATRRRDVTLWPFAATAITAVVVSGAFYGLPRFRLPLEVSIAVLLGVAADGVIRRLRPGDEAASPEESEPDPEDDQPPDPEPQPDLESTAR
jgi:hypothetical protein